MTRWKGMIRRGALLATFRYVLLAAILGGAVFLYLAETGAFRRAPEHRTGAVEEVLLEGGG